MATRRTIDPSVIASLSETTKTQVVGGGFSKTLDDNFPVWSTPVDKEFIIYIPSGPSCKDVDGVSVFDPAVAHIHNIRSGKNFSTIRCMQNVVSDAATALGYNDGECPACKALQECYEKYNTQLAMKAKEMGLDPADEKNNDALRPIRQALRDEMAIQKANKKYVFPIVVISDTGLVPDAVDESKLETYFFPISESAYEKKLMKPLSNQYVPITNPAGRFYKLSYKYEVPNGGKPNARDAAREMTITLLVGAEAATDKFKDVCEKLAAGFTPLQANTSVTEIAYQYAEDVEKELERYMTSTRAFNASVSVTGGAAAPALPNAGGNSLGAALGAFGATASLPDASAAAPTEAPAQAAPAPAPTAGFGGFGAPTGDSINLNG